MTIRNLDRLFKPKSVAIVGASGREGSVGAVLSRNLLTGGFDGAIMPVNPKRAHVQSIIAYPTVSDLPFAPDLAVIATAPSLVPDLISKLGEAGTKAAVVVTAGFGEGGDEHGGALRQEMLDAARPHLLRIIGPNCLGIMVPGQGLNASFGNVHPLPGKLAFVTQSGAVVTSVVDWATSRNIGFSHIVSLGDMSDVDFGDMLDYLANDRECSAILLYIEAVTHARKFMSAARAASRTKPLIVVKAGRHEEGARAAASHTGALAGSDDVYDAAFRRAGMLRVTTLDRLFEAVGTLGVVSQPKSDRIAIVTNGGGMGVLATDALIDEGGVLAELAPETVERLNAVLPETWSKSNPVDIIGDAPPSRYADALDAVCDDKGVGGVLVLHCPTAIASSTDAADAVIAVGAKRRNASIFTAWVGGKAVAEARQHFTDNAVPTYDTPSAAVRAVMQLINYQRNQETLIETPPSVPEDFEQDADTARSFINEALADGREWLNEHEAKSVLEAYGIPIAKTMRVTTDEEAGEAAAKFGGSVVLKVLSNDILHKSDIGGVVLNLEGPAEVEAAARSMRSRIAEFDPSAKIDGFTVQTMVRKPGAHELLVGVNEDVLFGPMIMFGQGGTAVEVIADSALAMPPLNMKLAHEAIAQTQVVRLLRGYRDRPAANLDAIAMTMVKVSQLVVDIGEIAELDINPLLADSAGVIALDARIRVREFSGKAASHLAIRPYPKALEAPITLNDGRKFLIRPIVPEDEPAHQRMFASLTPEEIRLRFLIPKKTQTHVQAARFTQIDYDREMALVLADPGPVGQTDIHGVVRISADPDNEKAEFAILVQGELAGLGLGTHMMLHILAHAEGAGIQEIFGEVLRENSRMLGLAKKLGFVQTPIRDDPGIVHLSLKLPATDTVSSVS